MKKSLVVMISFLSLNVFSQKNRSTPSLIVDYNFSYFTDTVRLDNQVREVSHLFIYDKYSNYVTKGKYLRDSLWFDYAKEHNLLSPSSDQKVIKINTKEIMKGVSVPRHSFNVSIYKDFVKNNYSVINFLITSRSLSYRENMNLKWVITNKIDTILGFQATEATTFYEGRNYHAWFISELPIGDGPYKFYGLPGLIVRVYDEKKLFRFDAISINDGRQVFEDMELFAIEKDYMFKSKNQVFQIIKDYTLNPSKHLNPVLNDPKTVNSYMENFKRYSFLNLEIE
jgi:GLPGLI family protein